MTRKEAVKLANEWTRTLQADEHFFKDVLVTGISDRTRLYWDSAEVKKVDNYYHVAPEHHEAQVFHVEEYNIQVLNPEYPEELYPLNDPFFEN
jgi:hypothetical protein